MFEQLRRLLSQNKFQGAYQQYVPVRYQRPGCGCGGGCGCLLLIILAFMVLQLFSCIPNLVLPPEYIDSPWSNQGKPPVLQYEPARSYETEQERIERKRRKIEREKSRLEQEERQLDLDEEKLERSGSSRLQGY